MTNSDIQNAQLLHINAASVTLLINNKQVFVHKNIYNRILRGYEFAGFRIIESSEDSTVRGNWLEVLDWKRF